MDPVLEDLKDFENNIDLPKRSRTHKFVMYLIAIFMLSIIIIYFLPGDVIPILKGKAESSSLSDDFTISFYGGSVIFDENVYQELKDLYLSNEGPEIKVCLKGEKQGTEYYVTSLEVPKIFSQSVFHVSSEGCSSDILIHLHTHPYKHCLFSDQDIKSYGQFKKTNPDAIIGLMCEVDRFNFYGN